MTETIEAKPKKNRLLKILCWSVGIVLLLLVVTYFIATSAGFLKSVILPRAGTALNSQITVSDASISPFKEVVLTDFKLQPNNAETLVTAREVRARYSLMDIIRGNINIEEVAIAQPTITLVTRPDGTSNLDPLMKSFAEEKDSRSEEQKKTDAKSEPTRLNLRKLTVSDAVVRMTQAYEGGNQDVKELSKANVALENLRNGQTGKLTLEAILAMKNNPPDGTNASLQGTIKGQFDLALDQALGPASIQGNARVAITEAQGGFAAMSGFDTLLEANVTPSELKQALLRFQKGSTNLGEVRAAGPFSLEKLEGKIQVAVQGIDNRLLNLAGANLGMTFGKTRIESTNEVTINRGGSAVTAAGRLNVQDFQVTRTNQTTPVMNLGTSYDVTVDMSNSVAVLRELAITGNQSGLEVIRGTLSSPMQIAWGEVSNAVGDSVFDLALKRLNLADWRAFAGDYAPEGIIEANATVASKGKLLDFKVDSRIHGLTVIAASNRISQLAVSFTTSGKATDLAVYDIHDLNFSLDQANRNALAATARGVYNLTNQTGNLDVTAKALLPIVSQLVPMPDLNVSAGVTEVKARISQKGEKQTVVGSATLTDLTARFGSNVLQAFGLSTELDVAMDTNRVDINKLTGTFSQAGRSAGSFNVAGNYLLANGAANLDVAAQALLPVAARIMPLPDLSVTAGTADLKARVARKGDKQIVNGSMALKDFNGAYGSNVFQTFGTTADLDIAMDTNRVDINKLSGNLSQAGKPGGAFEVVGNYVLTNSAANLKISLRNLNQNALRPFLEPMLTGKQLVSLTINGDTDVQFNPESDSTIKGSVQMTNLVVKDLEGKLPATPLELALRMDVGMKKQVADIRQVTATLTPTERAKNEVVLQGRIDLSNTNYTQGNLSLAAESLDFTKYYDLFMGETAPAQTAGAARPASTPSPAPSADPEKEPDKVELPVRNFTADLRIGRFYLHELEATNLVATLKLDGSRIAISPFSLALNGAPVKATINLDLGVPGYKYAFDLSAVQVPYAPIVNTFMPDRKGQIQGTLTAVANVTGMGFTGPNLQRHLAGKFDIGTTNLNLQLSNIKSPLLRTAINVITILPDILKGGGGDALGSLAGAILGGSRSTSGQTGGWSGELSRSPVDIIQARGTMGSGRIDLQDALLQSRHFQASTRGDVTLAPVLTNSTLNFPLSVSLTRDLAARINMVPPNTPTNQVFVQLPEYVSIRGTLGQPKQQINAKALLGTALQQLGGTTSDQKTGNLMQGLGGILSGQRPAAPATNAPAATNQPPAANLLQGLGGLLGEPSAQPTNSSKTNTNRPRSRSLLDQLLQ